MVWIHVLTFDSEGLPVDPAIRLYGPPVGYLLIRPALAQLAQLARANNLTLPPLPAALAAQASPRNLWMT